MNAIHKVLQQILDQMDVPKLRKDTTKLENLRWLKRNLFIQNKDHNEFPTAIHFINHLLKDQK